MIRTTRLTFVVPLVAILCSTSTLQAAPLYHVTDLGTLPGFFGSNATAINKEGQIVGYSNNSTNDLHAFLYSGGTMKSLGTLPGGLQSVATGINDVGQISGYSVTNTPTYIGLRTAFVYDGSLHPLGTLPGANESWANGINGNGQTAGLSGSNPRYDGFLYNSGTMTDLGSFAPVGINNNNQIIGSKFVSGWSHAFLDTNGSMTDLGTLGGTISSASALNDSGQAVGYSFTMGNGFLHAFLYANGGMIDMGTLGNFANESEAYGINRTGQVVGFSSVHGAGNGRTHAFLYGNGTMLDLNNLLDESGSGWLLTQGNAINDNGWIVGQGQNPAGGFDAFLLTPTPEPSSLALAVLGFLGLMAWLLKRRTCRRMAPA